MSTALLPAPSIGDHDFDVMCAVGGCQTKTGDIALATHLISGLGCGDFACGPCVAETLQREEVWCHEHKTHHDTVTELCIIPIDAPGGNA